MAGGDGPLTPLLNLPCTTDTSGNLVVTAGVTSGSNSATKVGANTRCCVNSSNALIVAFK
jgi:hypothetical protein